MAFRSPDLGIPELAQGQVAPEVTFNDALVRIQITMKGAVSREVDNPPGGPTDGDAYIIGPAPTGAWAGRANALTVWWGNAWRFLPDRDDDNNVIPMGLRQAGMRIWVNDEGQQYVWDGTEWLAQGGGLVTAAGVFFDGPTGGPLGDNVQDAIDALYAMILADSDGSGSEGTVLAEDVIFLPPSGVPYTNVQEALEALFADEESAPGAYDPSFYFVGGAPDESREIEIAVTRPFLLAQDLVGSETWVATPFDESGDAVFTVQKNGATVGFVTFASGSNTATFNFTADISFDPGDRLSVIAPANLAGMAGVSIGFRGVRGGEPLESDGDAYIPASQVIVTPSGNIASDNAQDAFEELDSEKVAKAGDTMTGLLALNWTGFANPTLPVDTVFYALNPVNNQQTRVLFDAISDTTTRAFFMMRRARGADPSTPTSVLSGNNLGSFGWTGYLGTAYSANFQAAFEAVATEDWDDAGAGCRIIFVTTPNNTLPRQTRLTIDQDGGLFTTASLSSQGDGTFNAISFHISGNVVIDSTRLFRNRVYTVATLPAAGTAGRQAYASNLRVFNGAGTQEGAGAGTGGVVSDNGTNWKIAGTNVTAVA